MGRMSNRDRIAHAQAEAAAAESERLRKKAGSGSSRSGSDQRMKLVWTVCNSMGKVIETYPYAEKARAEVRTEELSDSTRDTHELRSTRVPMDD